MPIDPRDVLRFSLYYRAASVAAPPWQVVAADIDLSAGRAPPQLLLDATLSGEIDRQGELATVERDVSTLMCINDADCDDHRSCNGRERCAPRSAGADARGCVKGNPVVCPVNQVCTEGKGCVGARALRTRCRRRNSAGTGIKAQGSRVSECAAGPGRNGVGSPCAQAAKPAR